MVKNVQVRFVLNFITTLSLTTCTLMVLNCEGAPATPNSCWASLILSLIVYLLGDAIPPIWVLNWWMGYYGLLIRETDLEEKDLIPFFQERPTLDSQRLFEVTRSLYRAREEWLKGESDTVGYET